MKAIHPTSGHTGIFSCFGYTCRAHCTHGDLERNLISMKIKYTQITATHKNRDATQGNETMKKTGTHRLQRHNVVPTSLDHKHNFRPLRIFRGHCSQIARCSFSGTSNLSLDPIPPRKDNTVKSFRHTYRALSSQLVHNLCPLIAASHGDLERK